MIFLRRIAAQTDVTWATPTSGYGHLADEQPLPFIHHQGVPITPMVGGDASFSECGPSTIGLPFGVLSQQWPFAQRIFNLTRRSTNLYWRNVFKSRCRPDRFFFLHEQLDFTATPTGFRGVCPFLQFERRFAMAEGEVHVTDVLEFRKRLAFEQFTMVVLPLFPEWQINGMTLPRVEIGDVELQAAGIQRSAAGTATLWVQQVGHKTFAAGERLQRDYIYRWSPA